MTRTIQHFDVDELMKNYGSHEVRADKVAEIMHRPEVEGDAGLLANICLHIGYELGKSEIKQKIAKVM